MFVCAAVADPRPVFTFRFNGERITSNNSKYSFVLSNNLGTLTVFNLQGSDEGTYTCSASNRYGSVSTAAILTVQGVFGACTTVLYWAQAQAPLLVSNAYLLMWITAAILLLDVDISFFSVPPTIVFSPSAVRDVVRGENLVASCRANADPPPMIQWFRGNQMLNDGDQLGNVSISQSFEGSDPSSQLTVTDVTSDDAGMYSCVAVNSLGNDSKSFLVNVVGESAPIHYKLVFSTNAILPLL